MRFEWLKDRQAKEQFRFYWRAGNTNLADYFTKHHPPAHHRNIRHEFLTRVADLRELRERTKQMARGEAITSKSAARVCWTYCAHAYTYLLVSIILAKFGQFSALFGWSFHRFKFGEVFSDLEAVAHKFANHTIILLLESLFNTKSNQNASWLNQLDLNEGPHLIRWPPSNRRLWPTRRPTRKPTISSTACPHLKYWYFSRDSHSRGR